MLARCGRSDGGIDAASNVSPDGRRLACRGRVAAPACRAGGMAVAAGQDHRAFGAGRKPRHPVPPVRPRPADRLGQPFVVENRSGGAGNIGFDAVAKSRPDGYTIMIASDPLVTNPIMYGVTLRSGARFRADHHHRDAVAGAGGASEACRRAIFAEFVALARVAGRTRSMSAPPAAARPAIWRSPCWRRPACRWSTCPIAAPGLRSPTRVGGQIQATIVTLPATIGMIKQNQLRALAVTSSRRSRFMPDLPSMTEHLPGTVVDSWQAFFAPAGTPPEIVAAAQRGVRRAAADEGSDGLRSRPRPSRRAAARRTISASSCATRLAKWAPIIKAAGIRAE